MRLLALFVVVVASVAGRSIAIRAQNAVRSVDTSYTVIAPARVFDGMEMHDAWSVVVRGDRILSAGPTSTIRGPPGSTAGTLPRHTLMPRLIQVHSHVH